MIGSPARRREAILPAFILPALVAAGILFGGLDSGIGQSGLAMASALLLGWQLSRDRMSGAFWRTTLPVIALLGLAALWAALASSGYLSPGNQQRALTPDLLRHELVGLGGMVCLLLTAAMAGYRRGVAPAVDWLVRFGGMALIIALMLALIGDSGHWSFWTSFRDERFLGTLNNANVAAAAYGMVAVLALSRAIGATAAPIRITAWFVLAFAIGALAITASRAGMVFAVLAAIALLVLQARKVGRASPVHAAILIGAFAVVLTAPLSYRLFARLHLLETQFDFRLAMWSHFADVAGASPWIGYGLGSFPAINARYAGDPYDALQMWTVNSPHNLMLSLILGAGWPYALLILGACAMIVGRLLIYRYRQPPPIEESALIVASLLLIACSMVDIGMQVPALAASAMVMTGLAWGRAIRPSA